MSFVSAFVSSLLSVGCHIKIKKKIPIFLRHKITEYKQRNTKRMYEKFNAIGANCIFGLSIRGSKYNVKSIAYSKEENWTTIAQEK